MTTDTTRAAIEALLRDVTPGPWQADAAFCKNDHPVRVAMPDWAGVPQATIAECDHNWNDADCGKRRISWKEAEANARFIAAARDLVPALAARLAEVEADRDAGAKDYCSLMDRHDAAIVRATAAEAAHAATKAALDEAVAALNEAISAADYLNETRTEFSGLEYARSVSAKHGSQTNG